MSVNYDIVDDSNTSLAGNGTWYSPYSVYLGYSYGGPFQGKGNKYVGVRFTNATGEHFGWIQVILTAGSSSLTIVDWAWEDEADTPILAGAGIKVVPTLNEWGLIVLMTLLAGAAAWKMKQPELLQA